MKLRKRNISNTQSNSIGSSNSTSTTSSIGNKRAKKSANKSEEEEMQRKLEEGENEEMPCYFDAVPTEIMEHFFRGYLDFVDRLRVEPVSKRWKWILQKAAVWKGETKIDFASVTRGHPEIEKRQITDKHLIPLFEHVGANVKELDLHSFGSESLRRFVPEITKSLKLFPKFEKLNIDGFELADFIALLPSNLRQLKTSGAITLETLTKLSEKCQNLDEVPFHRVHGINLDIVCENIRNFPRLKKLDLVHPNFMSSEVKNKLASIAELKELEVLEIESDLFSDSVLEAIARQEKLKRLIAWNADLTDESIIYLIDRCKSLVSLDLDDCKKITERSLTAVITEVHRRHGRPPQSLPTGPLDNGIFYFYFWGTGIEEDKALEMAANNPWLVLDS